MKELLLHIGFWKTGTTTIQESLYKNRELLEKEGVCYPSISSNHTFLPSAFHHDPDNFIVSKSIGKKGTELKQWHEKCLQLFNEELRKFDRTIVSSEFLLDLNSKSISSLKDYLFSRFEKVNVIVYLRDPANHLSSAVNEQVKQGHYGLDYALELHSQCKEYEKLANWISAFGYENFYLRKLEKKSFKNENIIDDFLLCWNMDGILKSDSDEKLNTSLSYPAVLIADKLVSIFGAGKVPHSVRNELFKIKGIKYKAPLEFRVKAYKNAQKKIESVKEKLGVDLLDLIENYEEQDATSHANEIWNEETILSLSHLIKNKIENEKKLKAENYRLQALLKLKEKNNAEAERLFQLSLSQHESFSTNRDYAFFLYERKNFIRAMTYCQKALSIHPDRKWLNELYHKIEASINEK